MQSRRVCVDEQLKSSHFSTSRQSSPRFAALIFSKTSSRVTHVFVCPFHAAFWHSAPQYEACLQRTQRLSALRFLPQCEQLLIAHTQNAAQGSIWRLCHQQLSPHRPQILPSPKKKRLFWVLFCQDFECPQILTVARVLPVHLIFFGRSALTIRKAMTTRKAMSSCSYCGTQRAELKRCSRCKQASYCGVGCQNAAWKGHKKTTCMTLDDVFEKVNAARWNDWRAVLKWEGRMEELLQNQPDAGCIAILARFSRSHALGFNSTGNAEHALSNVRLEKRKVEVLGKMHRFRDQGEALCLAADQLLGLGRQPEAEGYFERARKIAEEHGFFSVECESCLGLGKLAMADWREEEGVELLRNALVCVPLCEEEDTAMELNVLHAFTNTLLRMHAIDEVEPLVARFRETATAFSEKKGRVTSAEFHSLYARALLHEVLCTCTPCWEPPHTAQPLHSAKADSVCHRFHLVRAHF